MPLSGCSRMLEEYFPFHLVLKEFRSDTPRCESKPKCSKWRQPRDFLQNYLPDPKYIPALGVPRKPLAANNSGTVHTKERLLGAQRDGAFNVLQKTGKEELGPRLVWPNPSEVFYKSFSSATTYPY